MLTYAATTSQVVTFYEEDPTAPSILDKVLSLLALLVQKYKYWCKSTNTFYEEDPAAPSMLDKVLSLLALLVPKYKY